MMGIKKERELHCLLVGVLLALIASPLAAQICTETITLRTLACAGTATCTTKGSELTLVELDGNQLDIQDLCDAVDGLTADITDVFNCASGDCNSIAIAATDLLNLSGSDASTATEGLILPQHATACAGGTAEGQVCWEADANILHMGDGAAIQDFPPASAISGDMTMSGIGAVTIGANTVALTTDTTGGYAASTGEAGGATSLEADGLDAISEIAAGIKRGPDATDTYILTTAVAAPAGLRCLEMDTDGSVVVAADTCSNLGPGGTTSIDALGDSAGAGAVALAETAQVWTGNTAATAGAFDLLTIELVNDASTDAAIQRALVVTRPSSSGTAAVEALILIENLDTDGAVVAGIEFVTAAGGMTVAIDASDSDLDDIIKTESGGLVSGADLDLLADGSIDISGETNLTASAGAVLTGDALSVDHDTATNFVADEHVAHGGVTLTAGAGLGGGGTIAANRTFTTASGETDFLISGALTCGASTQGRAQVHTTPLQYCDNAGTPALQYAAYADSSGLVTDFSNANDLGATGDISANAVALSTDTTGNYAAGDAEAGAALTGDSATSFFSTGTVEDARIAATLSRDTETPGTGVISGSLSAGYTIDDGEIVENDLAGTLTFDATDFLDLSGIDASSTTEGLRLPQIGSACAAATAEGQVCWDTVGDDLYVGDGSTAQQMNAAGGGSEECHSAILVNGTQQGINDSTQTEIDFDTTSDDVGGIADLTNNRITLTKDVRGTFRVSLTTSAEFGLHKFLRIDLLKGGTAIRKRLFAGITTNQALRVYLEMYGKFTNGDQFTVEVYHQAGVQINTLTAALGQPEFSFAQTDCGD